MITFYEIQITVSLKYSSSFWDHCLCFNFCKRIHLLMFWLFFFKKENISICHILEICFSSSRYCIGEPYGQNLFIQSPTTQIQNYESLWKIQFVVHTKQISEKHVFFINDVFEIIEKNSSRKINYHWNKTIYVECCTTINETKLNGTVKHRIGW